MIPIDESGIVRGIMEDRVFKVGQRVKVDGEIATILYFTPGHWTTHAVCLFPEGDERAILIEELESGRSRMKIAETKE